MSIWIKLGIFFLAYLLIAIIKAFRDVVAYPEFEESIFSKYRFFRWLHVRPVPFDDWHLADGTIQFIYVWTITWLISGIWHLALVLTILYLYIFFYSLFNFLEEKLFRK